MATPAQFMQWNGTALVPMIVQEAGNARPESRRNRNLNGSFETGVNNWSKGTNISFTQSATQAKFGTKSAALTRLNATSGSGFAYFNTAGFTAGQQVCLSMWMYGGVGPYSLQMSGTALSATVKQAWAAPGALWVQHFLLATVAASGSINAYVHDDTNTTPTNGAVLYIDGVQLEIGVTTPTPYLDGDTPDANGFIYDWLGTPGASESVERDQRFTALVV